MLNYARMCRNGRCREWLDADATYGLCPSCWFIARVGGGIGAAVLVAGGIVVKLLLAWAY